MTIDVSVFLGRINANEDEAKIAAISVGENSKFDSDQVIFELETTKATLEFAAPCKGAVTAVYCKQHDMLTVGDRIVDIEIDNVDDLEEFNNMSGIDVRIRNEGDDDAAAQGKSQDKSKITLKAKMLARKMGIDPASIETDTGLVTEDDVRAFAEGSSQAREPVSRDAGGFHRSASACLIYGAGGHSKSIVKMIRESGYDIVGVIDPKLDKGVKFLDRFEVLGQEDDLPGLLAAGIKTAFIGVGGASNNSARTGIFERLEKMGFRLPPLISRLSALDEDVKIGSATYVFPGASIGHSYVIGNNCIINQGSILCHDSSVGDHSHLAPGAIVAGGCEIGRNCTVGMAATIMNAVKVGDNCLVHNTVAVNQDLDDGTILTLR